MEEYGSQYAHVINFRDTWIFVSSNREQIVENYESNFESAELGGWVRPLFTEVQIGLKTADASSCSWEAERGVVESEEVSRRRTTFCELHEGFGSICHCEFYF